MTTTAKNTELWTAREAAEYLGVPVKRMHRWFSKGVFGTVTVSDGIRVVSAKSVRGYVKERERWMTVSEMAEHFGISKGVARSRIYEGAFPSVRTDETNRQDYRPRLLVLRRDVERFIASREEERVHQAREREARAAERENRNTPPEGYITAHEAERLLGLSRQRVHQLIGRDRFPSAIWSGWRWFLNEEEVLNHTSRQGVSAAPRRVINGEEHLTIAEISRREFLTYAAIRERVATGAYPKTVKVRNVYYIPLSDLANYRPKPVGRPANHLETAA